MVNQRPVSASRSAEAQPKPPPYDRGSRADFRHYARPHFGQRRKSLGRCLPREHEALALAMKRLGARSNSGEGGEDHGALRQEKMRKIKQVLGRFGR